MHTWMTGPQLFEGYHQIKVLATQYFQSKKNRERESEKKRMI